MPPWYDGPASPVLGTSLALLAGTASVLYFLFFFLVRPSRRRRRAAANAAPLLGDDGSSSGDGDAGPFEIERCPNPHCARCRLYGELNDSARRRLPWVVKSALRRRRGLGAASSSRSSSAADGDGDGDDGPLGRVVRSVRAGPDAAVPSGTKRWDEDAVKAAGARDGGGGSSSGGGAPSPVRGQRPTVLLIRDLPTVPVVTSLHAAACRTLEREVGTGPIFAEYRSAALALEGSGRGGGVGSGGGAEWARNDVRDPDGQWDVLHLLNQGSWVEANVELCPRTVAAVRSLPGLMGGCAFGNAFVSVLRVGTVIDPHCGPTNVRHRLHFPLSVPSPPPAAGPPAAGGTGKEEEEEEPEPELRVLDERLTWTEGRCVVFDDSLVHSAVYPRSKGHLRRPPPPPPPRVVLIVDLWHPDLTDVEREVISDLYPAAAAAAAAGMAAT